jgi:CRISPR/Cas system-associated endonuclease Cas1
VIAITRDLLERKLLDQAEILARLPYSEVAIATIHQQRAKLVYAHTPARLRVAEAHAAAAYWAS